MKTGQHVFLIGIGGAGLSAIAKVLLEQGYTVSGSDLCLSPAARQLTRLGATVYEGHSASHMEGVDSVIVSSAVPADNPEVVEAVKRGIPVFKRAEWLGQVMSGGHKRCVGVAGTHGKTTTTAMLALIAREAGLEPTFIVGGYVNRLGSNAAAGSGDLFIIEADEYDRTFLGLKPDIAVVTVLEWDHPDCYPTYESMVTAYHQFVSSVPENGLVIGCGDEPGVRDLLAFVQSQPPPVAGVVTYGVETGNDWQAVDTQPNTRGGYDFRLLRPGEKPRANDASANTERTLSISLVVPGIHNVKNALAALVAADSLGVPVDRAAFALSLFDGVERRFQIKGTAGGVLVVDDYAHHPTEIRATLSAARARYPDRPIWVVFQPHTYSRTLALLDDFAAAFAQADHVILVDIYAAREVNDGTITSADVANRISHPDVRYIGSLEKAAAYLIAHLEPDAVLITLGAGDGYQVGEMVLRDESD